MGFWLFCKAFKAIRAFNEKAVWLFVRFLGAFTGGGFLLFAGRMAALLGALLLKF